MSTDANIRSIVNFVLGGIPRRVRVRLRLALRVEELAGRSVVVIVREFLAGNGRITDGAHVLRAALGSAGAAMAAEDVLDAIEVEGWKTHHGTVVAILTQLFRVPEATAGNGEGEVTGTAVPSP